MTYAKVERKTNFIKLLNYGWNHLAFI